MFAKNQAKANQFPQKIVIKSRRMVKKCDEGICTINKFNKQKNNWYVKLLESEAMCA